MSGFLANIGLLTYVLMAAAIMIGWTPNYFISNLQLLPQMNYRYIAASGIPFMLLLMTVAGRQAVLPRFRLGLVLEVFAAGLFLWLGLYSFYYLPQSNFFCAMHLAICFIYILLNYYGYRRELTKLDREIAARQ